MHHPSHVLCNTIVTSDKSRCTTWSSVRKSSGIFCKLWYEQSAEFLPALQEHLHWRGHDWRNSLLNRIKLWKCDASLAFVSSPWPSLAQYCAADILNFLLTLSLYVSYYYYWCGLCKMVYDNIKFMTTHLLNHLGISSFSLVTDSTIKAHWGKFKGEEQKMENLILKNIIQ